MYLNLNFNSRNHFPSFSIVLLLFLSRILYFIYSKTSLFPHFYWKLSSLPNCSSLKLIYIFLLLLHLFFSVCLMSLHLCLCFPPPPQSISNHIMICQVEFSCVCFMRFTDILKSRLDILQQFGEKIAIISSIYYKSQFRYWTF